MPILSFELRLRVLSCVFDTLGSSLRERIQLIAARSFTDTSSGHSFQFTWRTISTWVYRHKKHGMLTLENKTRSDKDLYRKIQVNQVAQPINEVLPTQSFNKTGIIPKSVLYRLLLQRGFFYYALSSLPPHFIE